MPRCIHVRAYESARALLVLALAVHLHQKFHGPPLDYLTLAIGSFASWVGVPGPGEPLLIAAGVLAAKGRLDLGEVVLAAWAGATLGGIGGWLLGMRLGRALVAGPGPLRRTRERTLERGEEVFNRFPRTAVVLTPTWVAGILRVRASIYLPWNAIGALLWAAGIAVGAYFVGPPVVDAVDDAGLIPVIALATLVLAAVGLELVRRRRTT